MVLTVASAVPFFAVGRTIQRRDVSPEARQARTAFATWWYGLDALTAVGVLLALPGFPLDLRLFLGLTVLLLGVLCAALAGLVHYLVFLYTSRRGALPYIAAGYGAVFLLILELVREDGPVGLKSTRFGPQISYAHEVMGGPLYLTVIVLFLVPPIVAALAYLSLYWKVREPVLKRRILLVSVSIA